jgi:hypothetical protein
MDISGAILESRSTGKELARYRPKEEQLRRLHTAFDKWATHGDVWSAAASKVWHLPLTSHSIDKPPL